MVGIFGSLKLRQADIMVASLRGPDAVFCMAFLVRDRTDVEVECVRRYSWLKLQRTRFCSYFTFVVSQY